MHLGYSSFRVGQASLLTALIFAAGSALSAGLPLGYLTRWSHGGGRQSEAMQRLESLAGSDPEADAVDAIFDRRYGLYMLSDGADTRAHGVGYVSPSYLGAHGSAPGCDVPDGKLDAGKQRIVDDALSYMARYNQIVQRAAPRPWLAED
jgi:hypothetical protein